MNLSRVTEKTAALVIVSIVGAVVAQPATSLATVKPTIENMVSWSDAVVVATITSVDTPGAPERIVAAAASKVLKGSEAELKPTLRFSYKVVGKINLDFAALAKSKTPQVIFLKKTPSHAAPFKLTDEWFGMEPASSALLEEIKKHVGNERSK